MKSLKCFDFLLVNLLVESKSTETFATEPLSCGIIFLYLFKKWTTSPSWSLECSSLSGLSCCAKIAHPSVNAAIAWAYLRPPRHHATRKGLPNGSYRYFFIILPVLHSLITMSTVLNQGCVDWNSYFFLQDDSWWLQMIPVFLSQVDGRLGKGLLDTLTWALAACSGTVTTAMFDSGEIRGGEVSDGPIR